MRFEAILHFLKFITVLEETYYIFKVALFKSKVHTKFLASIIDVPFFFVLVNELKKSDVIYGSHLSCFPLIRLKKLFLSLRHRRSHDRIQLHSVLHIIINALSSAVAVNKLSTS